MKTFYRFIENRFDEAAPPPTGAPTGIGGPGNMPPPMGSGGLPPSGGMVAPPMGGLGGGMGMPPMPPAPGTTPSVAPNKLKAYNVWDVLERVLEKQ